MKRTKLNLVLAVLIITILFNVFSALNIIGPSVALGCNMYSDCGFCSGTYCPSGGCCCYDYELCFCWGECWFCGCMGSGYRYSEWCPGA